MQVWSVEGWPSVCKYRLDVLGILYCLKLMARLPQRSVGIKRSGRLLMNLDVQPCSDLSESEHIGQTCRTSEMF